MEVKSLKEYARPKYPTIEQYANHPEIFLNHTPKSWIDTPKVWTALVAFCLTTTQCEGQNKSKNSTETVDKKGKDQKTSDEKNNNKSFVAPIFVHGEGIGAIGCIVMNPPIFITEKEARQVIINEFKRNNIEIDTVSKKQIKLSKKQIDFGSNKEKIVENNHTFDGYNSKLNFVFDFISSENYYNLKDDEGNYSSVSSFDYKKLANDLREKIINNKKMNAVIFYDPVVAMPEIHFDENSTEKDWKRKYDEADKKAQDEAKSLLIKQVDDFIEWLKKEKYL